jgi:multicomponent K+:H+ antiporter subunit A
LLETAGHALLGDTLPAYELAVWHGFTAPLLMSFVALTGGIAFYLVMYARGRTMARAPLLSRFDSRRAFDIVNVAVTRTAGTLSRKLFPSRLQVQLLLIVLSAIAAGFWPLRSRDWVSGQLPLTPIDPLFVLLWVGGAACAVGAALQAKFHRLVALILLGGAGLITCLTFAWFSAPDLALTQIVVETVTIVLFLLGLRWLPRRLDLTGGKRRSLRTNARRTRDAALAITAGAGLALLAFAVITRPVTQIVAPFFVENALAAAGGRNIVNVILVDFRGLDTLGEITVVGTVALIVYGLLRRFRPAADSIAVPRAQRDGADQVARPEAPLPDNFLKIPAVLSRLVLPFAGLVSLYFLLRGHNAPGGGFVGGLVMATAVIVHYMVSGTMWVEARLKIAPQVWIAFGLLAAVAAGLCAWLAGQPFLTALSTDVHVPLLGELHLSSVLLFDLGVYMLVVGAAILMLIALAHQSLRSPRHVAVRPADQPEPAAVTDGVAL